MSAHESDIEREARLFEESAGLPVEERNAYLDESCGSDQALRARIESLLEADSGPAAALERPAVLSVQAALLSTSQLPERVGPYRIIGLLGAGGMGLVYEAEQEHPTRRVALKVVRPGLVTESLLRRFEHEARVLGWLNHPGIAQIYDAGTADSSSGLQPYFAMELVQGLPLTRYAEAHELDTQARLALLARVCDAVQHAHQKGVIHRDLKPGNVLVEEDGSPKVVDFGVARVTDADLLATTQRTQTGELVGTLSYMSPEQVAGQPGGIDTRSDVYALGVIAHELLAGRPPHDLRGKLVHEAARVIIEDEPSTLGDLDASLRGDVETIVAKSIEKDPERRYASAEELARDIRRFLGHEPIVARPASALYQLKKLARRNRVFVGASVVTLTSLLAGTVISTLMYFDAASAREEAERQGVLVEQARAEEQAQKEEAVAARDRAREETAIATEVKNFLVQLFNRANPLNSYGREVTLLDVLERGAVEARENTEQEPRVRAEVLSAIALTYQGMGHSKEALPLMEEAARVARSVDTPEFADAKLRALRRLGRLYMDFERLEDSRILLEEAQVFAREAFGADHAMELRVRSNLGLLRLKHGDLTGARDIFASVSAALEGRELDEVEGQEVHDFIRAHRYYASHVMSELGDPEGAIAELRALVAFYDDRDRPDDPALVTLLASLGQGYLTLDRVAEAGEVLARAWKIVEEQLGPESMEGVGVALTLGQLELREEDPAAAQVWIERAVAALVANDRQEYRDMGSARNLLAGALERQGRFSEALDQRLAALDVYDRIFARGDATQAATLSGMRELLIAASRRPSSEDPHPGELLLERAAAWLFEHDRGADADQLFEAVLAVR